MLILKRTDKVSEVKEECRAYSKRGSSIELRNYCPLMHTKANSSMNPSLASLWTELHSTRYTKDSHERLL